MSMGGQTGEWIDGWTEVLQYPFCCLKKASAFINNKILFKFFPNYI